MDTAGLITMNQTNETELADAVEFQNVVLGSIYIVLGTIYVVPLVPCVIALCSRSLLDHSCYKIMASMAITDLTNVLLGSLGTGFCSILGVSYVENYMFYKFVGSVGNCMWYTASFLNVSLAINRAVNMRSAHYSKKLFGGNRTWIWIGVCYALGGVCFCLFISPLAAVIYHSGIGVFVFDPMGEPYGLSVQTVHDWSISIGLPALYIVFWLMFRWRMAPASQGEHLAKMVRSCYIYIYPEAIIHRLLSGTTDHDSSNSHKPSN